MMNYKNSTQDFILLIWQVIKIIVAAVEVERKIKPYIYNDIDIQSYSSTVSSCYKIH